MSTRPMECGLCGRDHPSSEPCQPVNQPLLGRNEELTFLVHRHKEYGEHWVMIRDDQQDSEYDDAYTMMRDRVIDSGGQLYYVKARAVVVSALLEEGEEDVRESSECDECGQGPKGAQSAAHDTSCSLHPANEVKP
jgi:hypothetical protein